jgi:phosphoenolpyruvate carboxykinase (GTP)
VFNVNWFRKGEDGKFLWPGFGDNLRVLEWMLKRVTGQAEGNETAIGILPQPDELNVDGLRMSDDALAALLAVDAAGWQDELAAIGEYLDSYGERMPASLKAEQQRVATALADATAPAARKAAAS